MWPGGPVYLIYSSGEAERFGKGNFEGIKFVRGGLAPDADSDEDTTKCVEKT